MKLENKGVGLDIGTTKIVAMLGRKKSMGNSKSSSWKTELRVHRGVVNNITQTIQSIQSAVQEAEAASVRQSARWLLELLVNIFAANTAIISRPNQRRSFRSQMWKS